MIYTLVPCFLFLSFLPQVFTSDTCYYYIGYQSYITYCYGSQYCCNYGRSCCTSSVWWSWWTFVLIAGAVFIVIFIVLFVIRARRRARIQLPVAETIVYSAPAPLEPHLVASTLPTNTTVVYHEVHQATPPYDPSSASNHPAQPQPALQQPLNSAPQNFTQQPSKPTQPPVNYPMNPQTIYSSNYAYPPPSYQPYATPQLQPQPQPFSNPATSAPNQPQNNTLAG
eukprot:Sdes_comp20381_c0_seq1m14259